MFVMHLLMQVITDSSPMWACPTSRYVNMIHCSCAFKHYRLLELDPVSRFGLEGNSRRRQKLFSYLKVDTKLMYYDDICKCINVRLEHMGSFCNGTENHD